MDGDCLSNSSDEEAAGRRPCRLFPQFLQQRNEVWIFEARNVSKAGVLGICTKHVLQCLVEKRHAEQNEHDLKRLRSERSPPEVVRRPRGGEEQRVLFQAARDPRPVVLAPLCFSLFVAAVILTAGARRVGAPYPVLLALGGAMLAFVPSVPSFADPPELALALFVAPVLTAFSVVLGTLAIQGLMLKPLLRALDLHDDDPVGRELSAAVDSSASRSVRRMFFSSSTIRARTQAPPSGMPFQTAAVLLSSQDLVT